VDVGLRLFVPRPLEAPNWFEVEPNWLVEAPNWFVGLLTSELPELIAGEVESEPPMPVPGVVPIPAPVCAEELPTPPDVPACPDTPAPDESPVPVPEAPIPDEPAPPVPDEPAPLWLFAFTAQTRAAPNINVNGNAFMNSFFDFVG